MPFRAGMVVTESVRIKPGTYTVEAPASLDSALMTVRGSHVALDMEGVVLQGLPAEADPDRAAGVAVRVDGGSDIRIRGVTIRGYRFGILARGTRGLLLAENDLSYSWKPRLFSLRSHESLVDWLSYHHNEAREWMRFGAAIYLEDVVGGEIRGNRAVQGMNGLLMVRTDSLTVRDNEFTYNSGLGIGMYRSSHNTVVRNRLDYDVRGYNHGYYRRGQDSAGLLMYEQSTHNLVAYNSATHSGDGLFLWAGQSTMDTGRGGANDNYFFGNDFSYSPTNGMEATFSRNRFVANRAVGNDYGLWGGYSWKSILEGNCFAGNRVGVAIEHGQENVIRRNRFDGDSTAVALWANESEPADWGYPRARDTRSRDDTVSGNVFSGNARVWRLSNTAGLTVEGNRERVEVPAEACRPRDLLGAAYDSLAPDLPGVPPFFPSSAEARRDRSAIVVDEWGPYDAAYPRLWPADTLRNSVRLRVLGPRGRWRLVRRRGVAGVSAESGRVGDTLTVTPAATAVGDWGVEMEYVGEATRSSRGIAHGAGEPVTFSFERFEPISGWNVRFYAWADSLMDPHRDPEAADSLWNGSPLLTRHESRLDYEWYRPLIRELPRERWALEATASVTLDPGEYTLSTISDDGIRVWVDGRLAIDRFDPHGSEVHHAPISPGRHDVRVRYYQLTGWAEVRVEIVKGRRTSTGSPGPH